MATVPHMTHQIIAACTLFVVVVALLVSAIVPTVTLPWFPVDMLIALFRPLFIIITAFGVVNADVFLGHVLPAIPKPFACEQVGGVAT